ncbi:MAG: hypothetical protein ACYTAN_08450 [Planctomycetota bacterium]|jgi:hypothetical protein
MEVTKDEAAGTLSEIERVDARTRRRILFKGADAIYMLWGVVWIVAFTLHQFVPHRMIAFGSTSVATESLIWSPLVLAGIIGTLVIFKRRAPARGERDWRTGVFWGVLFAYFYVYLFLLWPVVNKEALFSEGGWRLMTAAISIVPMFAYVVMGLWGFGDYMIWLGLGVTAATVVGVVFVPTWFYLWMAVFGGGALLATGVITRRRWAKS